MLVLVHGAEHVSAKNIKYAIIVAYIVIMTPSFVKNVDVYVDNVCSILVNIIHLPAVGVTKHFALAANLLVKSVKNVFIIRN